MSTGAIPTTSTSISASATTPADTDNDDNYVTSSPPYWDYLFIIIAAILILSIALGIWVTRRKKRKNARIQNDGVEALARDLENLGRTRHLWGHSLGAWRASGAAVNRHDEGLDEGGEAPPPYNAEDKPPSMASLSGSHGEHVSALAAHISASQAPIPMRPLPRHLLPRYPEWQNSSSGCSGVAQETGTVGPPAPAVVASIRPGLEVDQVDVYHRMARPISTSTRDRWASTRCWIGNDGSIS